MNFNSMDCNRLENWCEMDYNTISRGMVMYFKEVKSEIAV